MSEFDTGIVRDEPDLIEENAKLREVNKALLEACKAALARLAATRISDVEVFHQISAAVALAEGK